MTFSKTLFISALFLLSSVGEATTFSVDVSLSKVGWLGGKNFGENHSGVILIKEGSLELEKGKLNSGKFTIDMNSIKCEDIKEEGKKAKLEGHLKSADFFDVSKFGVSSFEFEEAADMGNGQYSLQGKMTIRGITKNETVMIKLEMRADGAVTAISDIVIDRTKYGILYKSEAASKDWFFMQWFKTGKDKIIKNELEIKLDIVALKSTAEKAL